MVELLVFINSVGCISTSCDSMSPEQQRQEAANPCRLDPTGCYLEIQKLREAASPNPYLEQGFVRGMSTPNIPFRDFMVILSYLGSYQFNSLVDRLASG